jgi:hypothetical protein
MNLSLTEGFLKGWYAKLERRIKPAIDIQNYFFITQSASEKYYYQVVAFG